jgi:hypothetical protein
LDQPSQSRLFFDDLGIIFDVHGSRQAVGKTCKVGCTSNTFQFVRALEFFFESDQVDRPGIVHEMKHLFEDSPVTVEIEVLGSEAPKDRKDGPIVEKNGAKDGSFRFQVAGQRFFKADVGHFDLRNTN